MPDPTPKAVLAGRWLLLLAFSAAVSAPLELAGLPAVLLIGPMLAGIAVAVRGWRLRVPDPLFMAAQALVGCMVAASITGGIVSTVAADWPLFLAVTASTIGASALMGYLLSRWHVLPGTAAVWGSSPGAASAMVIMAQAYGADARLVAVMTYTRVVAVSVVASLVSLLLAGPTDTAAAAAATGFLDVDPVRFAGTVLVALVGAGLGRLSRLPGGALLGPTVVGAGLNVAGVFDPQPPQVALALAFALIGWRIGLNFTRETVRTAAAALPRIVAAMLVLIAFCGGIALALVRYAGIDPATAYLAASPGGMDSIAIIAATANDVDRPFVMALQTLRFVAVLLTGPALARFVAERHLAGEKRRAERRAPDDGP